MVWLLIACVALYAWETSHFQVLMSVHQGGPWLIRNAVELGLPAAVVLVAVLALEQHVRKGARLSTLARGYLWLGGFTLIVTVVWGGLIEARYIVQGLVFAFIMDIVLRERGRLVRFLWGNAVVGVACVALNTVPVLHFSRLITLPTTYIERFGGGWEATGVKILSFGVFGRAEWDAYPLKGVWFNRLHGWSFEPIHWAYFVFWTAVCCLLLLSHVRGKAARRSLWAALAMIVAHLYFVFSAAAFLVLALTAAIVVWHRAASLISPGLSRITIYLAVVVGGGLAGPMVLAMTPSFTRMITEERVLAKGDNWESKVAFVRLGSKVLTRVVPNPAMADGAGHNLVLSTYLAFGVFGVFPLLAFEWRFLRFVLRSPGRPVQVAGLLSLVAMNHQVPWMLFYPLGAIWVVTICHAARFAAVQQRPVSLELTLAKTA